jgi:hypothetical protein
MPAQNPLRPTSVLYKMNEKTAIFTFQNSFHPCHKKATYYTTTYVASIYALYILINQQSNTSAGGYIPDK